MISKEAKRAYDKDRYLKRRESIFGDRKCAACGIRMTSKCGAWKTRTYCRGCSKSRHADRTTSYNYYWKNREKILTKLRERTCV